MKYKIIRPDAFVRTAKRFFKKHPQLIGKFKEIIYKLEEDPFDPGLRTHKLKGNLKDKYGVSLNYQYRITVTIEIREKEVVLMDVGTHDEVY